MSGQAFVAVTGDSEHLTSYRYAAKDYRFGVGVAVSITLVIATAVLACQGVLGPIRVLDPAYSTVRPVKSLSCPFHRQSSLMENRADVLDGTFQTQNIGLSPQQRNLKNAKMRQSAWKYFRGNAHMFYRDIYACALLSKSTFYSNRTSTWITGDAHMENFGTYKSTNGQGVYSVNDFDEGWFGPYLLDLWRLTASVLLVAKQNGFGRIDGRSIVDSLGKAYLRTLNTWVPGFQITIETSHAAVQATISEMDKPLLEAQLLDAYTTLNNSSGIRQFEGSSRWTHELSFASGAERTAIAEAIEMMYPSSLANGGEVNFTVKDVARRINAGTGSLGMNRFYVLVDVSDYVGCLQWRCQDVLLDVKQQPLVPARWAYASAEELHRMTEKYGRGNDFETAKRVVDSQRAMLYDSEPLTGFMQSMGIKYVVNKLSPYDNSVDIGQLTSIRKFKEVVQDMASALASAHAHTGGFAAEVSSIAKGRSQKFIHELWTVAEKLSNQANQDWQTLRQDYDVATSEAQRL